MQFIIHGMHITENLLHHKLADVRRILEEKGFGEDKSRTSGDSIHFLPASGAAEKELLTMIQFDDAGFVAEDGVSHSEDE
jgi:hypothetical protein